MRLKGNLHAHSRLSDGVLEPRALAERYAALEYDFLAITDHRCLIGSGQEATDAYLARLPVRVGQLLVLAGVEEEPPELDGRHVGVIRAGEEELRILNHPSEYAMSIKDVLESVQKVGAHAVEVTCHGRYLSPYDTDEVLVPRVATDDSHFEAEIGVSWIEVEVMERTPAAILRAVKAGLFTRRIGHR